MVIESFIQKFQNLPVVDTALLLAGQKNVAGLKVQLSRWVTSGKLIQLRRGLYILATPYQKVQPLEYHIASLLKHPSYVSLEKALAFHGMIPEGVAVYTCLTSKRPAIFKTPLGIFTYRHIKTSLFWGYQSLVLQGQTFFMASPEKAILDLIYLNNIKVSLDYLHGLRLQNCELINQEHLLEYAARFQKPFINTAAKIINTYLQEELSGEKRL